MDGVNYFWDFENNSTSTSINPTTSYIDTGLYTINLYVTSLFGCVDSTSSLIEIIDPPIAAISFIDSGCAPLEIAFDNSSYGKYSNFGWDFGNGMTSNDSIPVNQVYSQSYTTDTTYYISFSTTNLCGVDSILDSIIVTPKPTSIFLNNLDFGCSPLTVSFLNFSVGNPDIYHWDFGDGTVFSTTDSLLQHTFYTSSSDTTYIVSLIAENECDSDTSSGTITVYPDQVTGFFTVDTTSGCLPLTISFQNYSLGSNLVHSWTFGDGNYSSSASPVHTFDSSGTFNVQYVVTDNCSYDTINQIIEVFPLPIPVISVLDDSVCGNDSIFFINNSINSSFYWEFGDGSSSFLTNPIHSYDSSGIYDVIISLTSLSHGCFNSDTITVSSLISPEVAINLDTIEGCSPLTINFTNNSSNADSYLWDFGDGNSSIISSLANTYQTPGSYSGYLIGTNNNGCFDSTSFNVTSHPNPQVDFTYSLIDTCYLPMTVSFTNNSIGANFFEWNFDGIDSSITTNPYFDFNTNGSYDILLVGQNNFGCIDSISNILIIDTIPFAAFELDTLAGCIPLAVNMINNSTNYSFTSWDFGNGNFSISPSVNHIYFSSGLYQIKLVVEDVNGCKDSTIKDLTVYPEPISNFSFSNTDPCFQPVSLTTSNNSLGANYYNWNFGNLTGSTQTTPTVLYDSVGVFNIELIAGNSYGCEDTSVQILQIFNSPVASMDQIDSRICLRDSIVLSSLSQNADSLVWNVNGIDIFNSNSDSIYYISSAGIYSIDLYAYQTISGCADTASLSTSLEVLPSPTAAFDVNPDSGCQPLLNVAFINQSLGADSYIWNFGNGNSSSSLNSTEQYFNSGNFQISLHVSNIHNCQDSAFSTIQVFPKPIADFLYTNSDPCIQPTQISTTNLSTGAVNYYWDFGNGQTSSLTDPTSSYLSPGTYTVNLIVESVNQCYDTINKTIEVLQSPIPDFTLSDDTICVGDSVIFVSQSQFTDSTVWVLSDGFTFTGENFVYFFNDTSVTDVSIYTFNSNGCLDSLHYLNGIVTIEPPIANFLYFDTVDRYDILSGNIYTLNLSQNCTGYFWEFYDGTDYTIFEPIHEYQYYSEGNYPILLTGFNSCGIDTAALNHYVKYEKGLFVPNSIYPDHPDEKINKFNAVAIGLEDYELWIHDTYGNLIYYTKSLDYEGKPDMPWNGSFRNEGLKLKQDVYVWRIKAKFKDDNYWEGRNYDDGEVLYKTGTVTLLK